MLQCEGEIKISEIQAEFGGVAPSGIAEYYSVDDGVPSTGQIAWSDFHCKAKPITFSASQNQCIDHWAYLYYDGNGKIYIDSVNPREEIHTGRGDCGGYAQGRICIYAFDKSKGSTLEFTAVASYSWTESHYRDWGRRTDTYSNGATMTKTLDVNLVFREKFGFTEGGGGAKTINFSITGKIS